ncbi:hypothetical protein C8C83_4493 [Flavobacterium sp. 90]|uniref:hypothetical protein n=1 Tax=unclassified Flavobacterium TaxID=196869 RepID=UPI000EB2243E|nr:MULTISPECIES: hypothetical protein [unclassified Flavobacterium]RKR05161.1 hypothetical protein C8C82_4834 [Flavobacterium sp. 81]TCK56476.1 hypothetical protein C8C83_4493 [Flavobacterium sp. 90]
MSHNNPKFEIIPLDKLFLDDQNPRLPKSLQGAKEKDILEYMLLDASLIELMLAIGKNDFFPGEQLLVIQEKEGIYRVIEGNRRLSAVKLLNYPDLVSVQKSKIQQATTEAQYFPKEIPCLIFDAEENIHNYLGYRHITGIKEWKLLEKARYLFGLWKDQYSSLDLNAASRELAKSIGSRKDYVKRILIGYQIFYKIEDDAFYRIPGLDDTTFYFNYIADSLNKPHIANYLGLDVKNIDDIDEITINDEHLENWTRWLFEKNSEGRTRLIGDSFHLNALNKVLSHNEARAAFIEKGYSLDLAIDLTDEADSQFYNYLNSALSQLQNSDRLVVKVNVRHAIVSEQLKEIRSLAVKINRSLQEKEEDEDDI